MTKIKFDKNILKKGKRKYLLGVIVLVSVCFLLTGSISYSLGKSSERDSLVSEISYLSNNELELKLQNIVNDTFDRYLREYSNYFDLDSEKVVEFARNITNNYEIDFIDLIEDDDYSYSKETKCMLFVYYLSRNKLNKSLSEYGLSSSYFKLNSGIKTISKDLMLDSGLSFSEFLGEVCDNLGMNKYYLLAISYLETGRVTSNLALNKNNFGGMRVSGVWLSYPTPEAGIISYILNLKGYKKYNLSSLSELSGIYVNGKIGNPSYTWVNSVKKYYNEMMLNPEKYFLLENM